MNKNYPACQPKIPDRQFTTDSDNDVISHLSNGIGVTLEKTDNLLAALLEVTRQLQEKLAFVLTPIVPVPDKCDSKNIKRSPLAESIQENINDKISYVCSELTELVDRVDFDKNSNVLEVASSHSDRR